MFQPLSGSLQTSIRFFFHPLPSREFRLCCLRPTKSNRPLLDSVGLILLRRLVFQFPLGAIFSAVEVLFTRFYETAIHKSYPLTVLVGAYQPYLALCRMTQFSAIVYLRSPLEISLLPLTSLGC
jgi:hypothetical protein